MALLFTPFSGVTNNRIYDDAFHTFTFSMQQCIVYMTKKLRIILIILDFKLEAINNRKDYLQTWVEFFFFHFFLIKTGKRDFLLDIYFAYKSCV